MVAIYLDGRHRPIADSVVSLGTATASLVHPREVFQPAIALGACALLIGHNHPSGDPTPSREDLDVTKRLAEAGRILGVSLLDHVVWVPDPARRGDARGWPDPWPGRCGHHEVWHLFVLAGAGAHYAFGYSLVELPYAPF